MKHLDIVGPFADLTFYSITYDYQDDGSLRLSFSDLSHSAQAAPNTLFNVTGPEACLAVVEILAACGQFVETILSMTLPNLIAPIPAMPGIASSNKVAAPGTPSAPGGPIIPMSSHLSQQWKVFLNDLNLILTSLVDYLIQKIGIFFSQNGNDGLNTPYVYFKSKIIEFVEEKEKIFQQKQSLRVVSDLDKEKKVNLLHKLSVQK
jgi:hypothetical protein